MAKKKKSKSRELRLFGFTISITTLSFVILYFWLRSMDNLFSDWLATNSMIIFIVTTILVITFVVFGFIKISALSRKGRGMF